MIQLVTYVGTSINIEIIDLLLFFSLYNQFLHEFSNKSINQSIDQSVNKSNFSTHVKCVWLFRTVYLFVLTLETKNPKRSIFQDVQKSNLHTAISGCAKIAPHKSLRHLALYMSVFSKDNI